MYSCFDEEARASCRASKTLLFEKLDQYIEFYSGFSDLVLDNFHFTFLYFALLGTLVFVAFCVHHLAKYFKRKAILILPELREVCPKIPKFRI